jgi:hypothetical protein
LLLRRPDAFSAGICRLCSQLAGSDWAWLK